MPRLPRHASLRRGRRLLSDEPRRSRVCALPRVSRRHDRPRATAIPRRLCDQNRALRRRARGGPLALGGLVYHSEHGQDRWLEENVFRGTRNGVFVEFGALDGLDTSNTLFFEREREWSGLLIEANPRSFCRLLESDRPRSVK